MVVATGLAAGFVRAWAVLNGSQRHRAERVTAAGFVAGGAFALFIVCVDVILELQ